MEGYPRRESHFAHRFVRVLHKSCAAQDIGPAACYLLCVIAHTEDAARYKGPVRFWNSQLMETMAFTSPKQLSNARERAIASGWLRYGRDGNRSVGKYFVCIPKHFDGLSDTEIEPESEWNLSPNHSQNGTNTKRIAERLGDELRNENETESGKPSYPSPNPSPVPKEGAADAAFDAEPEKRFKPEDLPLPPTLDCPEFVLIRNAWFAQRRGKRLSLREKYLSSTYTRLAPLGAVQAAACLQYTIDQDYDGIFPEKFGAVKNGKPKVGPGQRYQPPAGDA